MSLKTTRQLNIDFFTQKYISIDAKQYDRESRFILVTCYDKGNLMPINNNTCFAYVRYRKADNVGVFNECEITNDGKILIELTEQMLATVGMSYVDLVIHEGVNLGVEISENNDGEIEIIELSKNSILATMTFYINVREAAFDNKKIESSYEYDALNNLLIKARTDYKNVIKSCRESEKNAANSEANAKEYMDIAIESATNAELYKDDAESYMTTTKTYMESSWEYLNMTEAKKNAAEDAARYASECSDRAAVSSYSAKESEEASKEHSEWAKSYAVGGTGLRKNEDTANSQFFYEQLSRLNSSVTTGLIPMGTIKIEDLPYVGKEVGYMYNISNDFITDATFKRAGETYAAGTYVYCTNEGFWDCLVGITMSVANLEETKGYLQI